MRLPLRFPRRSATPFPIDVGPLCHAELELRVENLYFGDQARHWVPYYDFGIFCDGVRAGSFTLRVGNGREIVMYYGHIGYGVDAAFRGRHLAARACRLILPLARAHGLDPLWITCNPDNMASRRTCELAGAAYVETVLIPRAHPLWKSGEPEKCRYRLEVGATP